MPQAITKEECVQLLMTAYKENGKLTQKIASQYIHHRVVRKYFGTLTDFRKEYSLPMTNNQLQSLHREYTDEDVLNIIKQVYDMHGKVTHRLLQNICSDISGYLVQRRFGSIRNALEKIGIPIKQGQRKFVSKEEILKELDKIDKEYGYISKPLMERYSSYSPKIIQRIWGTFDAFYNETGYKRSMSGYIATDEELKKDLLRLQDEFGVVTQDIVEKYGKFSTTTYKERFGTMNKAYKVVGLETRKPGDSRTANWVIKKYAEYLNENPIYEMRFDWLKNPRNNYPLYIDAYFPKANIAIEYNGPQHYKIDKKYTTSVEMLAYRQWLDSVKYDTIRKHGIKLIVVHYLDLITSLYIAESLGTEG